jgi:hypothetical protein
MFWKIFIVTTSLLEVTSQRPPKSAPSRPPKTPPPRPPQQTSRPPGASSNQPRKKPSLSPTNVGIPVNGGSKRPITKAPTLPPLNTVESVLAQAKAQISVSIAANPPIAATYLRLGFHDCVPNGAAGGCDGCINVMSNPENNGLQPAIQSLAPIVAALENNALGISRADLWAYAALVAAERSQTSIIFTDDFRVGRKNCETIGTCSSTDPVFCASNGPDQASDFPSSDLTTHGLLTFMSDHFGFNADQTVAIMGAHSIGRALPNNSGFQGSWDNSNRVLGRCIFSGVGGIVS